LGGSLVHSANGIRMRQEQIRKQPRREEEVIEDLPEVDTKHSKELGEKALQMIVRIDEVTNG